MLKGFFTIFGDYDEIQAMIRSATVDSPTATYTADQIYDYDFISLKEFEKIGLNAGVGQWRAQVRNSGRLDKSKPLHEALAIAEKEARAHNGT